MSFLLLLLYMRAYSSTVPARLLRMNEHCLFNHRRAAHDAWWAPWSWTRRQTTSSGRKLDTVHRTPILGSQPLTATSQRLLSTLQHTRRQQFNNYYYYLFIYYATRAAHNTHIKETYTIKAYNSIIKLKSARKCCSTCYVRKSRKQVAFQSKAGHPRTDTSTFLLLWPWPWPDDLDVQSWPDHSEDVPAHQKWTFYVKGFESYGVTDGRMRSKTLLRHICGGGGKWMWKYEDARVPLCL